MIRRIFYAAVLCLSLPMLSYAAPDTQSNLEVTRINLDMEKQSAELVSSLLEKDQIKSDHLYKLITSNLKKLQKIQTHADFNERRAREMIMVDSWMRLISLDLKHDAWIGAAIAANQMRGEIIRFTSFSNRTLRDLAWMEYLSRDVMLLSMENPTDNMDLIGFRKEALSQVWQHVRVDMIKDFRNKPLVERGDQLMLKMGNASSAPLLLEFTKGELALVDELKKVSPVMKP
jgi:hypothetical protein